MTRIPTGWSPDDARILTASLDGTVRLYDAASGSLLRILSQTTNGVRCVAFSPDGRRLAAGAADGTVRLWDAATFRLIGQSEHRAEVDRLCFSPDGLVYATVSQDGTARVFASETGDAVCRPLAHRAEVRAVAFSPDGTLVATGSRDATARIWNSRTGDPQCPPLMHEGTVWSVEFSPDGTLLLTAGGRFRRSGEARFWKVPTGEQIGVTLHDRMPFGAARFSPDGATFATAGIDGLVRLWRTASQDPIQPALRNNMSVWAMSFGSEGSRLLTSSRDAAWRIWRLDARPCEGPMIAYSNWVHQFQITPDGRRIVSTDRMGAAAVSRIDNLDPEFRVGAAGVARHATISRNGEWIVLHNAESSIFLRGNSGPSGGFVHHSEEQAWNVHAISPDGSRMVSWNPGERPLLVRLRNPRPSPRTSGPSDSIESAQSVLEHDSSIRLSFNEALNLLACEFSPDGRWIAALCAPPTDVPDWDRMGEVRIWRADTGAAQTPPLLQDGIGRHLTFSPDSKRLATPCGDSSEAPRRARIWDVETGNEVGPGLRHADGVPCVQFSHDGRRLVSGDESGVARIWDAMTFEPLARSLRHSRGVNWAEFSPDGRFVVTASADGTARLWEAATGDPVSAPFASADQVVRASFTPDGTRIVTGSMDGTIRVWRLPRRFVNLEEASAIAAAYSGLEVNDDGSATPLEPMKQAELFQVLRRSVLSGIHADAKW